MLGFSPIASTPIAAGPLPTTVNYAVLNAIETADNANIALNWREMALVASEAPDLPAIDLQMVAGIYFALTEPPDTASGNLYFFEGYLAATEAPDTLSANLFMTGSISVAATEAPDTISAPIYVLWTPADDPTTDIWVKVVDGMPYNQTVI